MTKDFIDWLNKELNNRGWPNSELVKRSGLANSTVSMALSRQSNIGYTFCVGVANAFNMPPESIMRKAGLLPIKPTDTELDEQLLFLFNKLPKEQKSLVLLMIRALVEGWPLE